MLHTQGSSAGGIPSTSPSVMEGSGGPATSHSAPAPDRKPVRIHTMADDCKTALATIWHHLNVSLNMLCYVWTQSCRAIICQPDPEPCQSPVIILPYHQRPIATDTEPPHSNSEASQARLHTAFTHAITTIFYFSMMSHKTSDESFGED